VEKSLKIEGMTCAACAKTVERVTRKLDDIYNTFEAIKKLMELAPKIALMKQQQM